MHSVYNLPKKHLVLAGLLSVGLGVLATRHSRVPSDVRELSVPTAAHVAPPGFTVKHVRGDGNCFYYALAKTLNEDWDNAKVSDFKRELLQWLDDHPNSGVARAHIDDEDDEPGLRSRLNTDFEWAQHHEIQLAAEKLNRCIYVFKEYGPKRWFLTLSLPEEMRRNIEERHPDCLRDMTLVASQLDDIRYCPECRHKSSFLLNQTTGPDHKGEHFVALIPRPVSRLVSASTAAAQNSSAPVLGGRASFGAPRPSTLRLGPGRP